MNRINEKAAQEIEDNLNAFRESIIECQIKRQPDFEKRYGVLFQYYAQGINHQISYLAEAIKVERPSLFVNLIEWTKIFSEGLPVPLTDYTITLECLRDVCKEKLSKEQGAIAEEYIEAGLRQLQQPVLQNSFIEENKPQGLLARQYLDALLNTNRHQATQLILDEVKSGVGIREIYLNVFQCTLRELGHLWQTHKISVAQEHYCTAATQIIMSQLYPQIFTTKKNGHKMVAACVPNELHELGIRMVADLFEMDGWETLYLGADTPVQGIIQILNEQKADIIAISATMTFNLKKVPEMIQTVRSHPDLNHVKVLVGGYPFNIAPDLWQQVGADAGASNADEAVQTAYSLLHGKEK